MRTFIAEENCTSSDCIVEVLVPDYRTVWGLSLPVYQVHCQYLLLDTLTGYRNVFKRMSFMMETES